MKKILIIILVVLVLISGVMIINSKNNLGKKKDEIDKNGQKQVYQNQVLYIDINPLIKLEYEESFKLCAEPVSSKICTEILTRITSVDLLNSDAKRLYNNVNLLNKDIYEGIRIIIEEANNSNIDTSYIDIICDSGNFLESNLQLSNNVRVNYTFNKDINEEEVIRLSSSKYTIMFDTDGGSSVISQTIKHNDFVTKPENPTKNGYDFIEWQLNNKIYNFETPVTSDFTLKATWKEKEHKDTLTVTFNSNGGTSIDSQIIKYNEHVTKPVAPIKENATFVGWMLNGTEYDFSSSVVDDITLIAKWE